MVYKKVYEVRGANKKGKQERRREEKRRRVAIMLHTYANKC